MRQLTPKPRGLAHIQAECTAKWPNAPHGRCNCIRGQLAALTIDTLLDWIDALNDRSEELERELAATCMRLP
jgi:hypothetical protein